MGRRITTVKEIQNIVALGLDVWVEPPFGENTAWCMKQPHLIQDKWGLMLGNNLIKADYLPKWGIKDPNCTALMYIYNGNESRLYNDQQSAQNAINRRLIE